MDIEVATTEDLEALTDLWLDLAAEQLQFGSRLAVEENRESIRVTLAGHVAADTVLIARTPAVVGFVSFELADGMFEERLERGRIQNVYVDPAWRDQGIGSALLEAGEDALREAGADAVAIETLAGNERARDLYEDRGYRPHRIEYERSLESDTHTKDER